MHGITRAARSGLRAAIALVIVVMLGALVAEPAAADPAPVTPATSAAVTPDAGAPAAGSGLGLGLQLLGMSVKLNVLPLDLTHLVTINAAASTPASRPPTSLPRPPASTPVGRPTRSQPAPSNSTAPNANANGGTPGGSRQSNPPPSTATLITTPPPATATKTAPPKKPRAEGSLKLVKGLLPHTSALLLIVLIIGTTLAVALMVGFGARRGGRRV